MYLCTVFCTVASRRLDDVALCKNKCEYNLRYLGVKLSTVIVPRVVRYFRAALTDIGEDFRSITCD